VSGNAKGCVSNGLTIHISKRLRINGSSVLNTPRSISSPRVRSKLRRGTNNPRISPKILPGIKRYNVRMMEAERAIT
jgi:hypothetical protein